MSQTRLFVGNLPENVNEDQIREAFSLFGEITNLDLKNKAADDQTGEKKFAFVTLNTSSSLVESCIRHFSSEYFYSKKLYVTRARESFLERLQRERLDAEKKKIEEEEKDKKNINKKKIKKSKVDKATERNLIFKNRGLNKSKTDEVLIPESSNQVKIKTNILTANNLKKEDSDKKRIESMKNKRKEFKEKQMLIKTGLDEIDKMPNKKIIFSDDAEENPSTQTDSSKCKSKNNDYIRPLFDDDASDNDVSFEIRKLPSGKKEQKVLELQSRYTSDKRFVVDERFVEDEQSDENNENEEKYVDEAVELKQTDEKANQLNILQQVLGVAIKSKSSKLEETNEKTKKCKIGMLRFDPAQPDHAKFIVPIDKKSEIDTKKKKKNDKPIQENIQEPREQDVPKVTVSKEQFYRITDTLKESISQTNSFSIRSLFAGDQNEYSTKDDEQDIHNIPLVKSKVPKVKNPLDSGNVNPFKYDSSDSETEENQQQVVNVETDNAWKENFFFSKLDNRFQEGLIFFNSNDRVKKERRGLRSVMKKRLYNKDRKSKMFQKKIGGRRKLIKKSTGSKVSGVG